MGIFKNVSNLRFLNKVTFSKFITDQHLKKRELIRKIR